MPLSSHSQLLTLGHADAYSDLHGFLRCYLLSCTVAYFSLCGCLFLAPTAPRHVLGLNAYISRPFGHPSQIETQFKIQSDLLNIVLLLIVLGPKVYLKTLTIVISVMEVFKRSKYLFRLQNIGIFDIRFFNFTNFEVVINRIYLVYINVNSFAKRF